MKVCISPGWPSQGTPAYAESFTLACLLDAVPFCDVKIACGVHSDAPWINQRSTGDRTVVAAETIRPISRHSGDHAVRDLSDAVFIGVCDVEVAGGVRGDALRVIQLGAGGRTVVAAETERPISRHSGDHAARDL